MKALNYYHDNFGKFSRVNLSQDKLDKIASMSSGKSAEQLAQMIAGTSSAKAQYLVLASLYCKAVEKAKNPTEFGDTDMIIAKWNKGNFSESQINAVVYQIHSWI